VFALDEHQAKKDNQYRVYCFDKDKVMLVW
jgi:hypothetical protein